MNTTPSQLGCAVPDPRDRKGSSWNLSFKQGTSGHIIDKHVKNQHEPWGEILEPDHHDRLMKLSGADRTDDDHRRLKLLLLALAQQSCKRPQVVTFREQELLSGKHPATPPMVTCSLLICHCALLIVLRQSAQGDPSNHKIATAFFRNDSLSRARGRPCWKKLAAELIREYCPVGDGGRVFYPEPQLSRCVPDDLRPDRELLRSHIEFITEYTWNFESVGGQTMHRFSFPDWNPGPWRNVADDQGDR